MEQLKIIYKELNDIIGCIPNYEKAYKNQESLIKEIREIVKFMQSELGGFTSYD
mgnify:CR=1 FL=1|tara:strand:+ start:1250 stop:1411 length:162 start_codon:yes stop_codon:yes gene_type:complete